MNDKSNADLKKDSAEKKQIWVEPKIKSLGNAKKIVANINVTGGGDSQFSVLLPS